MTTTTTARLWRSSVATHAETFAGTVTGKVTYYFFKHDSETPSDTALRLSTSILDYVMSKQRVINVLVTMLDFGQVPSPSPKDSVPPEARFQGGGGGDQGGPPRGMRQGKAVLDHGGRRLINPQGHVGVQVHDWTCIPRLIVRMCRCRGV